MEQNKKPLWKELNEQRTQGEWDSAYGDESNSYGIFTKNMIDNRLRENPICLVSPIALLDDTDKANAHYIVLSTNNLASLAEALDLAIKMFWMNEIKYSREGLENEYPNHYVFQLEEALQKIS